MVRTAWPESGAAGRQACIGFTLHLVLEPEFCLIACKSSSATLSTLGRSTEDWEGPATLPGVTRSRTVIES